MATDVFINIKDLPELTEVRNGDYIIVESTTGTHLIDFKNLIMPTANTLISTTVNQNTNAIYSLSSSTSQSLSEKIDNIQTDTATISTKVTDILNKNIFNLNVAKTQITINPGNKQGTSKLSLTGNWKIEDLVISPANEYAAEFNAYPISVDSNGLVTIEGVFTRTVLVLLNEPSLTLDTSLPTSNGLSGYTVSQFTDSLSAKQIDISNFISNFTLSTQYIAAYESATYNVYAMNFSNS